MSLLPSLHRKIFKVCLAIFQHYEIKVQSCKLYNNKYTIASKQITNTEIATSIAVLVIKLL